MARRGFGATQDEIAGPLIGGGAAWAVSLLTRVLFSGKPAAKWSGAIGAVAGAGVAYGLGHFVPRLRGAAYGGVLTALVVGVPRQIEQMLADAGMLKDGYLGVITPEQLGYADDFGQPQIQLLDSGAGSTGVLGVTVPEQISGYDDMSGGGMGAGEVELLGGFGSNWAT